MLKAVLLSIWEAIVAKIFRDEHRKFSHFLKMF